jgi:SAM-dependent methyltransferase
MAGHDSRHGWDLLYSMTGPVPEPGPDVRAIVAVLLDLVGRGPVLELAVGDGRVAIPLAANGVDVDGIDISPNGIDNLRAHPGGARVNASVADISDFALPRKYSLIYCVANSLFNVPTQDGQVRCFELVADHLAPGGVFLVHSSYTPRWFEGLRNSQYVDARHFELSFAWFQSGRIDPAEQRLYQQDLWLSKDGIKFGPSVHRYAALGELDLMARIAGLQRRELWGGWTREPYTADSPMFVATYRAANEANASESP